LGNGSSGVPARRNMNWSLALLTTNIGVVGTPQMLFTNSITTTHVNKITDWPLTNSMLAKRYKSANVVNPKGGY
jgi:hypothetical protein